MGGGEVSTVEGGEGEVDLMEVGVVDEDLMVGVEEGLVEGVGLTEAVEEVEDMVAAEVVLRTRTVVVEVEGWAEGRRLANMEVGAEAMGRLVTRDRRAGVCWGGLEVL